jgi:hypothetical protein
MTDSAYHAQLQRQLRERDQQIRALEDEVAAWRRQGRRADRYRDAWQNARRRAQAYGQGILRHCAERDQVYAWLRAAEAALTAIHEGEEPYEDKRVVPTPGQWIWRWNRATAEERLQRAEQVIADYTRLDRARQVLVFHGDRPGWQQAVRAALDGTAEQPTCCVCGTTEHGGRTFYENYKGHLFCGPCADGDRPSCPLGDQCHGVDCPRRADHGARPSLAAPHTCRQCEPTP